MIHTQKITDDPHGRFWRYGWFYVRHYPGDGEQGGKPIPVPGKGENSWDCDDDAIHSSHGPHSTVHQAVAAARRRLGVPRAHPLRLRPGVAAG